MAQNRNVINLNLFHIQHLKFLQDKNIDNTVYSIMPPTAQHI